MSVTDSERTTRFTLDKPGKYRIRVQGLLNEDWSERLGGLRITTSDLKGQAVTDLTGRVRDQAELAGVLNTLYDLHLPILLVEYQDE